MIEVDWPCETSSLDVHLELGIPTVFIRDLVRDNYKQ